MPGKINITMYANTDSHHGCGLDLIFTSTPTNTFHGFPVIKATIDYPGPSSPFGSYGQLFGWIQFIKVIPINGSSKGTAEWEMDLPPFAKDLGTPFCYWGHNPTAFDAPCILLEEEGLEEVVWRAQSFLCVIEDACLSKRVKVLKDTAFGWGFDTQSVQASSDGVERKIELTPVEPLDLEKEWTARLALLRKEYPAWTFADEATS